MKLPKAELEHWMRDYYFECAYDLGSSGVCPYNFGEVMSFTGLTIDDLNGLVLGDSPTRGNINLRQALADRYGVGDADHVMVANGSNEILYHLLSTLLDEGDEVVVLETIYHALDAVPIAKKCNVIRWAMDKDNGYSVNVEELKSIVSSNTKLIAVNFPHNPTGVSISQKEQDQLIDIASSVDAYLVWDAAFEELTTTPLKNPFLTYHKAISVGTLSKSYGLPGLRVGWCFAKEDVIQKSMELRDYTTLFVSPLIELITTKVIENAQLFISNRKAVVEKNKKALMDWLSKNVGTVECSLPDAGVSCLLGIIGVENMDDFCINLAKKHSVMLVPGSCFGLNAWARLGFGESPEKFSEGLAALSEFVTEYVRLSKSSLI